MKLSSEAAIDNPDTLSIALLARRGQDNVDAGATDDKRLLADADRTGADAERRNFGREVMSGGGNSFFSLAMGTGCAFK